MLTPPARFTKAKKRGAAPHQATAIVKTMPRQMLLAPEDRWAVYFVERHLHLKRESARKAFQERFPGVGNEVCELYLGAKEFPDIAAFEHAVRASAGAYWQQMANTYKDAMDAAFGLIDGFLADSGSSPPHEDQTKVRVLKLSRDAGTLRASASDAVATVRRQYTEVERRRGTATNAQLAAQLRARVAELWPSTKGKSLGDAACAVRNALLRDLRESLANKEPRPRIPRPSIDGRVKRLEQLIAEIDDLHGFARRTSKENPPVKS